MKCLCSVLTFTSLPEEALAYEGGKIDNIPIVDSSHVIQSYKVKEEGWVFLQVNNESRIF